MRGVTQRALNHSRSQGNWVFLANCHLMTSWLPALDKLVEGLEAKQPHPNFRLWLSSSPSPHFPIATLQRGIKMTTEPPKGLRANLLRLYNSVSEASYTQCKAAVKYQKLLFALTYFHRCALPTRRRLRACSSARSLARSSRGTSLPSSWSQRAAGAAQVPHAGPQHPLRLQRHGLWRERRPAQVVPRLVRADAVGRAQVPHRRGQLRRARHGRARQVRAWRIVRDPRLASCG